jgi:hypothetical protein
MHKLWLLCTGVRLKAANLYEEWLSLQVLAAAAESSGTRVPVKASENTDLFLTTQRYFTQKFYSTPFLLPNIYIYL